MVTCTSFWTSRDQFSLTSVSSEVLVFPLSLEIKLPSFMHRIIFIPFLCAKLKGLHNLPEFQPGSPPWCSPGPGLCLHRKGQNSPQEGTGPALQIALVALLRGKIHQCTSGKSQLPTESFTHEFQLAHFWRDETTLFQGKLSRKWAFYREFP